MLPSEKFQQVAEDNISREIRNLHKYEVASTEANFMNLIFVLQDHELTVKPMANFKATLSLCTNISENYAKLGRLC